MKKHLQSDERTEHWSTKDGNQAAKATILNALDNTFEDLKMMELAPPPPLTDDAISGNEKTITEALLKCLVDKANEN